MELDLGRYHQDQYQTTPHTAVQDRCGTPYGDVYLAFVELVELVELVSLTQA